MIKSFLLKKTNFRRAVFFATIDGILLSFSLYLSFFLRFDGIIPYLYLDKFLWYLFVFLAVKFIVFSFCRLYQMSWSYVGFYELIDIFKAETISLLMLLGIVFMLWSHTLFLGFPRSIPLIDFVISLVLIVMFRASKRVYRQVLSGKHREGTKRTLIVGAGNAGEQIVRDMRRQVNSPYTPVGFIDDDEPKMGL
jgi:FlaA1/EpsC-like NDP-sugar epimerase